MLHWFGHHVAGCCMMLDDVEQSLISIKHRFQHHPTFLLSLSVNKNVAFVWPTCSTHACLVSWPCGYLLPWQWCVVYTCFMRSAWMLTYRMANEESFQSLSEESASDLSTNRKRNWRKSSRWWRDSKANWPKIFDNGFANFIHAQCKLSLLSKYETAFINETI